MRLLPFDYAVRNLGRAPARLALSVAGSALVALLVLGAAAFVRGMESSLRATGDEHNVILMGAGSEESVERSEVDAGVAGVVSASVPGIRRRAGAAYVSPEVHVSLPVKPEGDERTEKGPLLLIRGVTPAALLVHSGVQIVEGRAPAPGADEVMVGGMAAVKVGARAEDLAVGRSLLIDGRPWSIVGRFAAPGTVMDAEVWAPIGPLRQALKRTSDSCVVITLDPAVAEFADVAAFTKMRLDLELTAVPEAAYYGELADFFGPVRIVVWATAGLIGLGGLFGGLNTMYAAFVSRVREIGSLQALGFRRRAVALSMIQESTLAASAGGLIACAVGMAALDGVAVRFSMGAFGLLVDGPSVAAGLCAGAALGLFGALPPALRCLRLPIPEALKAV